MSQDIHRGGSPVHGDNQPAQMSPLSEAQLARLDRNLRITGFVREIEDRVLNIHARVLSEAGSGRSKLDTWPFPYGIARRLRVSNRYTHTTVHEVGTHIERVNRENQEKPVYRLDTYKVEKRDKNGWTGTYTSTFTTSTDDEGNPMPKDIDPKVELVLENGRATKVRFHWFHMNPSYQEESVYLPGIPAESRLAQFINGYATQVLFKVIESGDDIRKELLNLFYPHRCIELNLGDLLQKEYNSQDLRMRMLVRTYQIVDPAKPRTKKLPAREFYQGNDFQEEAVFTYKAGDEDRFILPGYAGYMKEHNNPRTHFELEDFAELALSMMKLFPNSEEEHKQQWI